MHRWYLQHTHKYVITCINGKQIPMHRFLMNAEKGQMIDHVNRNKLDNRRSNLRFCDKSTNGMNRVATKNNKSGYKNIYISKYGFAVQIWQRGRCVFSKLCKTIDNAINIRDEALNLFHKDFACHENIIHR